MKLDRIRPLGLIIACGCMISCISFGLRSGMGLYLPPISADYGWGRSIFSNAIAIQMLALGVLGPFAGALADRYGAAKVMALGGLLYAIGLVLTAHVRMPLLMYAVSGVFVGGALACTSFAIVFAVVGRVVPKERRSAAYGMITAAGSFGQFAVLPITQWLISKFDWQTALIASSALGGVIIVLALLLGNGSRAVDPGGPSLSIGSALLQAWRERGFHLLFWGYSVCGFQLTMLSAHLPALVMDAGLSPAHGVMALAIIGLFNIVGCLASGWLGGRFSKKRLLAVLYLTRAAFILALATLPTTPTLLFIFASGMGLLWLSTVPLTNGIVGQVFGLQYLAMLGSIVFLGHQIGSSAGVLMAGYLYDATGGYTEALFIASGLGVVAALLNLPINEKPISERLRPVAA